MRELLPGVRVLGFLGDAAWIGPFVAAGGDIVRLWECDLAPPLVAEVARLGRPIWVTTGAPGQGDAGEATAASLRAILRFEPDGILVNDPRLAFAAIAGERAP